MACPRVEAPGVDVDYDGREALRASTSRFTSRPPLSRSAGTAYSRWLTSIALRDMLQDDGGFIISPGVSMNEGMNRGIGHTSWLLAQRPSLGVMLNP
jgi:hypothetical protein